MSLEPKMTLEEAMNLSKWRPGVHYTTQAEERMKLMRDEIERLRAMVPDQSTPPAESPWRDLALRAGERLASVGPVGYYSFTPEQFSEWLSTLLAGPGILPAPAWSTFTELRNQVWRDLRLERSHGEDPANAERLLALLEAADALLLNPTATPRFPLVLEMSEERLSGYVETALFELHGGFTGAEHVLCSQVVADVLRQIKEDSL